jgi:hypothetical protein
MDVAHGKWERASPETLTRLVWSFYTLDCLTTAPEHPMNARIQVHSLRKHLLCVCVGQGCLVTGRPTSPIDELLPATGTTCNLLCQLCFHVGNGMQDYVAAAEAEDAKQSASSPAGTSLGTQDRVVMEA